MEEVKSNGDFVMIEQRHNEIRRPTRTSQVNYSEAIALKRMKTIDKEEEEQDPGIYSGLAHIVGGVVHGAGHIVGGAFHGVHHVVSGTLHGVGHILGGK